MIESKQDTVLLTVREVAALLNIHNNTVRRWSNMGLLKAHRIGPRCDRRFRLDDVVALYMNKYPAPVTIKEAERVSLVNQSR